MDQMKVNDGLAANAQQSIEQAKQMDS